MRGVLVSRFSRPYSTPYAPATKGAAVTTVAVRSRNRRREGEASGSSVLRRRTAAAALRTIHTAARASRIGIITRNATMELATHHSNGPASSASAGVIRVGVQRPKIPNVKASAVR